MSQLQSQQSESLDKVAELRAVGVGGLVELPQIDHAKECMGLSSTNSSNSDFDDDVLKVEVSGPEQPKLTLVDLPGLYYSSSSDRSEQGMKLVQRLTEKYMKSSRSIMLAVISARADHHLQRVLNIVHS